MTLRKRNSTASGKPPSRRRPGTTGRRKPAGGKRRKPVGGRRPASGRRRWLLWGMTKWLLMPAMVAFAIWMLWLDVQVRMSFSNLEWALPARIYARPLELYEGARVSSNELVDTLQRVGYRQGGQLDSAGEYQQQGQQVRLHSRGFEFWDGIEDATSAVVEFSGRRVSSLRNGDGSALPLLRLEPVEIAQINPETGEDRLPLALQDVPEALIQAVVAVEDRRFYSHYGIDPMGIARAMVANIRARRVVQGGSTITQQLIKNLYLHREQTLRRKVEEALMAVVLELRFSKEEILEAYLNEVFLGQEGNRAIHGFALGAEHYFGRPLDQLSVDEHALLAGMPRGPSRYNPRRNPELAIARRNVVLGLMAAGGHLSAEQLQQARDADLRLSTRPTTRGSGYPAFMALVRQDLARDYDADALRNAGLRIFTTLDVHLQQQVEARLDGAVAAVEPAGNSNSRLEAAVVITDANSGEVRALAGGRQAGFAGFNRALNARRPIGSLVKPAVYLAALESGQYSLASVLSDTSREIRLPNGQSWAPRNYDERDHGDVYLHEALERSFNLATVDLGMALGVEKSADMLRRLGYDGPMNAFPALLLGAVEMAPVEVAAIYQSLASGGFRTPQRAVEAVTTGRGERLQRYGFSIAQVADPYNMYLLEYAMQGVFFRGTARSSAALIDSRLPLAGKTGTTNELRDNWFAGYGDDLVGVVWLGHDDNRSTGLSGATGALRVWTEIMSAADIQPRNTPAPSGIEWHRVAVPAVRHAADISCQEDRSLPFRPGQSPAPAVDCENRGSLLDRFVDRVRSNRP